MSVRYSHCYDDSRCAHPMGAPGPSVVWMHRYRGPLILSSVVLWFLTSAILAVGIGVLFVWKRRQERAVSDFSRQISQLARDTGTAGRVGLQGKSEGLEP